MEREKADRGTDLGLVSVPRVQQCAQARAVAGADGDVEGMWFALAPGADVGVRVSKDFAVRVGMQLSFNLVRVRSDTGFDRDNLLSDRRGASLLGWLLTLGVDWHAL